MKTSDNLESALKLMCDSGHIVPRKENNPYMKVSYRGSGNLISDKWNVKIYTSGSVVCNDMGLLQDIINGKLTSPDISKTVLQCDDAGWGFCLGGVMVGVSDGTRIETDVVDVSYFRVPLYDTKAYLSEYARKGADIIKNKFNADSKTHRIEICTGYINKNLRELLRSMGYDVRVTEIKGMLQDKLEDMFRSYIKAITGNDLAYDPKEMMNREGARAIGRKYYEVLNWARLHVPNLLKNGWESLR